MLFTIFVLSDVYSYTSKRNTEFDSLNIVDWRVFDMVGQVYVEIRKGESCRICPVKGFSQFEYLISFAV